MKDPLLKSVGHTQVLTRQFWLDSQVAVLWLARLHTYEFGRGEQPVKLTCSGVSSFNGQMRMRSLMTSRLVNSVSAPQYHGRNCSLGVVEAHASFIKVSKAMAHARPWMFQK
eukprot:2816785-Amphidinium_carterae.1